MKETYVLKLNYIDVVEEHFYDTHEEAVEILKDLLMYYSNYETVQVIKIVLGVPTILYTIVNHQK